MNEEWRTCKGSENHEVSSLGNVRRAVSGSGTHAGRPLKGFIDNGYRRLQIGVNGSFRKESVHRLVAIAFIGPIPKGMQVNHKNGVKHDNRVENLEIVSAGENNRHAFKVLGRRTGQEKLGEAEIREIRRLYAEGETQTEISKKFPVTVQTIHSIVHRKSWARLT